MTNPGQPDHRPPDGWRTPTSEELKAIERATEQAKAQQIEAELLKNFYCFCALQAMRTIFYGAPEEAVDNFLKTWRKEVMASFNQELNRKTKQAAHIKDNAPPWVGEAMPGILGVKDPEQVRILMVRTMEKIMKRMKDTYFNGLDHLEGDEWKRPKKPD